MYTALKDTKKINFLSKNNFHFPIVFYMSCLKSLRSWWIDVQILQLEVFASHTVAVAVRWCFFKYESTRKQSMRMCCNISFTETMSISIEILHVGGKKSRIYWLRISSEWMYEIQSKGKNIYFEGRRNWRKICSQAKYKKKNCGILSLLVVHRLEFLFSFYHGATHFLIFSLINISSPCESSN